MTPITRRNSMAGLLGLGAAAALPCGLHAAAPAVLPGADIPPQGIGNKIRHIGYSDQGGRPDGVQVMINRKHLYVGHMFSDGMTTLDASDPRNLKPVNFFTAGVNTRTHHLQVANDLLLLHAVLRHRARLFREHARRQHHQSQAVPLGPFHS
jgi:hypothetical protein